jgi:hypothetical protein
MPAMTRKMLKIGRSDIELCPEVGDGVEDGRCIVEVSEPPFLYR